MTRSEFLVLTVDFFSASVDGTAAMAEVAKASDASTQNDLHL